MLAVARGSIPIAVLLTVAMACSDDRTVPQGALGQACYSNQTCNTGLFCVANICRDGNDDGGVTPDGGGGGSCPCPQEGATRCAGQTVQVCSNGNWSSGETCSGSEVCAFADCVAEATECPNSGVYTDNMTIVERLPPVAVSDCKDGTGAKVTYSEQKSETRQRTVGFTLLPSCASNPFSLGLNLSAIFGMDVAANVNSSTSQTLSVSVTVPPNKKYQFYRQTSKVHRTAQLQVNGTFAGTATLTDFIFTPDIAIGDSCPVQPTLPQPVSNPSSCTTYLDTCSCPPPK